MNRLPYAFSWWLDVVSPGWEALVKDNYEAVMPLTVKCKLGIHYLYQPPLTQQLGVFSNEISTAAHIDDFLMAIPKKYSFISIQLNSINKPGNPDFQYSVRNNFTLDLSASYFNLAAGYNRSCVRNLQKAFNAGLSIDKGPKPIDYTRFVYNNLYKKLSGIQKSFYTTLQNIVNVSLNNGYGTLLGVYSRNGELLTAGWFVIHSGRCLSLVWASSPLGKKDNANFFLADYMIRTNADTNLIFDFTGSNLPGVAYFNSGFGAVKNTYPALKVNRLPWPVRLFKR